MRRFQGHRVKSLNKPDDYILPIVEFLDAETHKVHYLHQPFQREPAFNAVTVDYDFAGLLASAEGLRQA